MENVEPKLTYSLPRQVFNDTLYLCKVSLLLMHLLLRQGRHALACKASRVRGGSNKRVRSCSLLAVTNHVVVRPSFFTSLSRHQLYDIYIYMYIFLSLARSLIRPRISLTCLSFQIDVWLTFKAVASKISNAPFSAKKKKKKIPRRSENFKTLSLQRPLRFNVSFETFYTQKHDRYVKQPLKESTNCKEGKRKKVRNIAVKRQRFATVQFMFNPTNERCNPHNSPNNK